MIYLLYDSSCDIENIVFDGVHYVNTFILDKYDSKTNIIGIIGNENDISKFLNLENCLGSNDADLALKHPDIAKMLLKVDVKINDQITCIPYGEVTKDMHVISQPMAPMIFI